MCTALPNGSKIAATSRIDALAVVPPDVGHRQREILGEGARAVDADALRVRAQVAAAGQAVAAAAADDVAFAADDVAGVEVARRSSRPSTISPTNSWPITIGTGMVFCAQSSHL